MKLKKPDTTKQTEKSAIIFSFIRTKARTMIDTLRRFWKNARERLKNVDKKKTLTLLLLLFVVFFLVFSSSPRASAAEVNRPYYNMSVLAGYYNVNASAVESYYDVGNGRNTIDTIPFTLVASDGNSGSDEWLTWRTETMQTSSRRLRVDLPYVIKWGDLASGNAFGTLVPDVSFDPYGTAYDAVNVTVKGLMAFGTESHPDTFDTYSFEASVPSVGGSASLSDIEWVSIANNLRDNNDIPSYLVPYALLDISCIASVNNISGQIDFTIYQPPYTSFLVNQLASQGDLYAEYLRGKQDGEAIGYENGYDVGLAEGIESANVSLVGWLLNSLDSLFDFELIRFGYTSLTIGNIVTVALCVPLLLWFLKLFAGG